MQKRKSRDDVDEVGDRDEFIKLHRVICTVSTFLSCRKHIPASFATLRKGVYKDLGRDLTEVDVAAIKLVIPDDVFFDYVDTIHLELIADPSSSQPKPADIYNFQGDQDQSSHVLVFEFIDGSVKRSDPKSTTKGQVSLPPVSWNNISKLVQKRLTKFRVALESQPLSVEEIYAAAKKCLPSPPHYVDRVEAMIQHRKARSDDAGFSRSDVTIDEFVEELQCDPDYKNQIVADGIITVPAKDANLVSLNGLIEDDLAQVLRDGYGIEQLFSHQYEALDSLAQGKHVVVTTSTSSGKSLIFQVPVLQAIQRDKKTTALFVFPTKALAQDQKTSLQHMLMAFNMTDIIVDTYDGDTAPDARQEIRDRASVILSNPDMMHMSILQHCDVWQPFLANLRYIVVDELHYYNGFFGTHVAMILRRLQRICHLMGNDSFQIICCSATINNPLELATSIFGTRTISSATTTVVSQDGSGMAARTLVLWETPYVSPKDPASGRVSTMYESARLLIHLVRHGIRTIAFCKFRRTCELVMKTVLTILQEQGDDTGLSNQIMSYRGGYSQADRRKIEHEMFSGGLSAIIATNALELGIDIGNLDAVLSVGFPFSISAFRQQMGRAGRRNQESLTLLVASGDPIDQYFMNNPQQLIDMPNVDVAVALENELIMASQLQCAAKEWPLNDEDASWFDLELDSELWKNIVIDGMEKENEDECYHYYGNPFDSMNIRGSGEDTYAVVETTGGSRPKVIETIEFSRVSFTLYEGGIFLHKGVPYLVQEVNVTDRYAKVSRVDVDWTTRQRDYTDIDPLKCHDTVAINTEGKYHAHLGDIKHCTVVYGFFKFDRRNRILDAVEVNSPPIEFNTYGFWINVPQPCLDLISHKNLSIAGGIHGAEHAILSLLPSIVTLSAGDVITECKAPEKEFARKQTQRKRPARLIFCDKKGSGISKHAFAHVANLIPRALRVVQQCPCELGCPECVVSTQCLEHSAVISKPAALVILAELSGAPLDPDDVPEGPEANLGQIYVDTIVPADPEPIIKSSASLQKK